MALPTTGYDSQSVTNPDGALTDFTLIVDLSNMSFSWWATVDTADGTKGRAAKVDGTELACDWINFDNADETGLLRVKWTGQLAISGVQTLRIYPPNTANTSVAAGDTYGSDNAYDANWEGYWPLAEDFNDRTSNANHASASGSPTAGGIAGHFGDATSFDGSTQYLKAIGPTVKPLTYILWFYHDSIASKGLMQQSDGTSSTDRWGLDTATAGSEAWKASESDGTTATSQTAYVTVGVWRHLAGVFKNATSRQSFLDGVASTENITSVSATPDSDLGINVDPRYNTSPWNGDLQDAQVHSTDRSEDWIVEEFAQTNDNATFWGAWVWTSYSVNIFDFGAYAGRLTIAETPEDTESLDFGAYAGRPVIMKGPPIPDGMRPTEVLVSTFEQYGNIPNSGFVTFTVGITGYYAEIPIVIATPNSTISAGAEVHICQFNSVLDQLVSKNNETIAMSTVAAAFPLSVNSVMSRIITLKTGEYILAICGGGWLGTTNLTASAYMGTFRVVGYSGMNP